MVCNCLMCLAEGENSPHRRREDEIKENQKFKAHKVMTPEEYAAMPLIGWHMVCKDFDGFGAVGVRFLGAVGGALKP